MLFRLPEKNIPKTKKIKQFIKEELPGTPLPPPSWLLDEEKIERLVKSFATSFGQKLKEQDSLEKLAKFLANVNLNRIKLEYDTLSDNSKELFSLMFEPLLDNLKKKYDINQLEEKDNNLIKFIKFLNQTFSQRIASDKSSDESTP
jgi:hypothetical protein